MKKMKNNNAVTLVALVITIVIMLLLAAIVIQMAVGENGLVVKTIQAKKEQAKAELYDTAKRSYADLKLKALGSRKPEPEAHMALATVEFRDKYDVVGDYITDKKGEKIDTKENVLKAITEKTSSESTPSTSEGGTTTPSETTTPEESTPKTPWNKEVGGVRIEEKDKDSTVIKLKVLREKAIITFRGEFELDGVKKTNGFGKEEEIAVGEYIVKSKEMNGFSILNNRNADFEIEILQWGKEPEYEIYIFELHNVTKIYEPEPDKVSVQYANCKFTEIPEWLFSKKKTSKKMSSFKGCENITSIPENLFKNNVEAQSFEDTFAGCKNITSIPENLFKYNKKAMRFYAIFAGCEKITSIPENLFKNNVEVQSFRSAFANCHSIINIPENLFRYNTKINSFNSSFSYCSKINNIPNNIIKKAKEVKENGGDVAAMFFGCTNATNYNSLPGYMR